MKLDLLLLLIGEGGVRENPESFLPETKSAAFLRLLYAS